MQFLVIIFHCHHLFITFHMWMVRVFFSFVFLQHLYQREKKTDLISGSKASNSVTSYNSNPSVTNWLQYKSLSRNRK